jgi:hypothetical protein
MCITESAFLRLLQVCDRGENARVEKSANVKKARGVGMLLLNTDPELDTLPSTVDYHAVPTVHLKLEHRAAVRDYAAQKGEKLR